MPLTELFKTLKIEFPSTKGMEIPAYSPINGALIAKIHSDTEQDVKDKIKAAEQAFLEWRDVPAPKRGELIRLLGEELRAFKEPLAQLVTLESGKIIEEGRGEVQEMIDICDFAVGLSRQLYGLTIASERASHVMTESWHPLGVVGVITAFNFPVAVWAWNFALAVVCGNSVIWKPSEKTSLCALAVQALFERASAKFAHSPEGLSSLIIGTAAVGEQLVTTPSITLVSATGSSKMGRNVSQKVAGRFGKSLLELGGNNAVIVTEQADLKLALPSIVFGAVGTAGQRCTTTRRLLVQKKIYEQVFEKLYLAYNDIAHDKIGNPQEDGVLVGPLIDKSAYYAMQEALSKAAHQKGEVFFGERTLAKKFPNGYYVKPALVKILKQTAIVKEETFAPILYVMPYQDLEDALELNNDVPQGLSSSIFTTDLREAEFFKSRSDCGIANVNIGTSGAEIGGAFGGEKETGGGRESGSDSWKNYMRRQTSTTYHGVKRPALAQGITFNV